MSHVYVKNEAEYKTPTDPDFSMANCQKLSRSCIIFKRPDFGGWLVLSTQISVFSYHKRSQHLKTLKMCFCCLKEGGEIYKYGKIKSFQSWEK